VIRALATIWVASAVPARCPTTDPALHDGPKVELQDEIDQDLVSGGDGVDFLRCNVGEDDLSRPWTR
jgi:hypothetical protein